MAQLNKWVTITPRKTIWYYIIKTCVNTGLRLTFLGIKPMYVLYEDGYKWHSVNFNFKTMEVL